MQSIQYSEPKCEAIDKPSSPVEAEYHRLRKLQGELQGSIAILTDRLDVVLAPEPNVGSQSSPDLKEVSQESKMVNMLRAISDMTNQSLDRINSTIDRLAI